MLSALLVSLLAAPASPVDTLPVVVVVVRHAEKAAEPARDPGLTDAGVARAAALDSLLADAKVTAILVTPYRRNRETAALVARRHGIEPTVIPITGGIAAYAEAVAAEARRVGGTVLVVGHSNTLDEVVAALGGDGAFGDLCDHQYQSVWTVIVDATGSRTIRSRFGAANPPAVEGCAAMH
jgi:phosphohistidine phosphatase SixA